MPGVDCQEQTPDALLESLRVALREARVFNRTDAMNVNEPLQKTHRRP